MRVVRSHSVLLQAWSCSADYGNSSNANVHNCRRSSNMYGSSRNANVHGNQCSANVSKRCSSSDSRGSDAFTRALGIEC